MHEEDRKKLAESLDDPLNRWYRYPAARGLFKLIGGLPLRPDHVTYIHTLIGVSAAALVAFGPRPALLAAAVLFEVRMVLDCYDGVLARAKKLSSPRGRTLDELGDAVSYVATCAAMTVRLIRTDGRLPAQLFGVLGMVVLIAGAMSGHAYDFYKRRMGSALKEERDAIAEELESKHAIVRRGNAPWITRFGIWFDSWQVKLYEPRYRANPVQLIVNGAGTPGVRFLTRLVGLMSWDNVLAVISIGIFFDRVLEVELVALAYGAIMFTTARVTIWRVLGGKA